MLGRGAGTEQTGRALKCQVTAEDLAALKAVVEPLLVEEAEAESEGVLAKDTRG